MIFPTTLPTHKSHLRMKGVSFPAPRASERVLNLKKRIGDKLKKSINVLKIKGRRSVSMSKNSLLSKYKSPNSH
jgi:hypothetical protein